MWVVVVMMLVSGSPWATAALAPPVVHDESTCRQAATLFNSLPEDIKRGRTAQCIWVDGVVFPES
jgi:hypothetical protein